MKKMIAVAIAAPLPQHVSANVGSGATVVLAKVFAAALSLLMK